MSGPLLAIDGDSLAHRAYHALPKSMKSAAGRPSGALVGFANFVLRLWQAEEPRTVVVGWDTLGVPTYRTEAFPAYQSGRQFDDALSWKDVEWVKELWGGKLIIKGILDVDDARNAVATGADALVVSNHGGRQLDGAPSSISVLPHIAEAVQGDIRPSRGLQRQLRKYGLARDRPDLGHGRHAHHPGSR